MTDPAPAGWYPDPDQAQTQRYWTGSEWTEQRAPMAAKPDDDGLVSAGWACAILFPLAGLVIGLVLVSRGNADQGGWIATTSLAIMIVAAVLLVGVG